MYLDKEKIQALIDKQRKTLADVAYLDLDSVANVIKDFENPELFDEDIRFSRSNSSFRLTEEDENNMVDINEEEGQVMFSKKRTAPKTESALKEQKIPKRLLGNAMETA